jgi:hypothetical protein
MRKAWFFLAVLFIFLVMPSAKAALVYSQNFDTLNSGATIVGQDSFTNTTVDGILWEVGRFPVFQGSQSVNCTAGATTRNVQRVITNTPNGSLVLFINSSGSNSFFQLQGMNGTDIIYLGRFEPDNDIAYGNNAALPVLSTYNNDQWYRMDFRWNNNSEYVFCVNGTTCATATNWLTNTGTPSAFRLDSPDVIGPDGVNTVDLIYVFDTFLPDESIVGMSIDSPQNVTHNRSNIELNVTLTESRNVSYSLDGAANISVENNTASISTGLFDVSDGFHQLRVHGLGESNNITREVNFTVNATGEARFVDSITGNLLTQQITLRIANLTNTQTTTTSTGTARFNWSEMPKGMVTIQVNITNTSYTNQSMNDNLGFFEDFNRSITMQRVGNYNASIYDEMRKAPFNFSIVNTTLESVTLKVFCENSEQEFNMSTPFNEGYAFGCEITEARLTVEFFDQTVRPFRSLLPSGAFGNLTFWVWENVTEDNVYLQQFIISDLVGTFRDGRIVIRKLINSSLETIHEVTIQPDGSAFAYLVDGERYQITILNSDGTLERNIGDFNAIEEASALPAVIEATTLEYNPAFSILYNDIGWTFAVDNSNNRLTLRYVDSANQTTSITYTVANASNVSHVFHTTTSTDRRIIYEFSYVVPNVNETYLSSFTAIHQSHSTVEESVLQDFSGIKMTLPGVEADWYMVIGMFLIIVTALLFGAKFNEIAGVVVAFEAGLFWYWRWFGADLGLSIILIGIALAVLNMIRRGERT